MLSSPHIPSECSLLEEIEVGLICHMITYLLFVIIILHRKENTYQGGWNEGYITLPFHLFQIISAAIPKQITSPHPSFTPPVHVLLFLLQLLQQLHIQLTAQIQPGKQVWS